MHYSESLSQHDRGDDDNDEYGDKKEEHDDEDDNGDDDDDDDGDNDDDDDVNDGDDNGDDDDDNDDEVPRAEWVPLPCRPKKHRQWNILPLGLDFSTPDKQTCLYLVVANYAGLPKITG